MRPDFFRAQSRGVGGIFSACSDMDHLLSPGIAFRAVAVSETTARHLRHRPRIRNGRVIILETLRETIALIEWELGLSFITDLRKEWNLTSHVTPPFDVLICIHDIPTSSIRDFSDRGYRKPLPRNTSDPEI